MTWMQEVSQRSLSRAVVCSSRAWHASRRKPCSKMRLYVTAPTGPSGDDSIGFVYGAAREARCSKAIHSLRLVRRAVILWV